MKPTEFLVCPFVHFVVEASQSNPVCQTKLASVSFDLVCNAAYFYPKRYRRIWPWEGFEHGAGGIAWPVFERRFALAPTCPQFVNYGRKYSKRVRVRKCKHVRQVTGAPVRSTPAEKEVLSLSSASNIPRKRANCLPHADGVFSEAPPANTPRGPCIAVSLGLDALANNSKRGGVAHGLFERPKAKVDDPTPRLLMGVVGDVISGEVSMDYV